MLDTAKMNELNNLVVLGVKAQDSNRTRGREIVAILQTIDCHELSDTIEQLINGLPVFSPDAKQNKAKRQQACRIVARSIKTAFPGIYANDEIMVSSEGIIKTVPKKGVDYIARLENCLMDCGFSSSRLAAIKSEAEKSLVVLTERLLQQDTEQKLAEQVLTDRISATIADMGIMADSPAAMAIEEGLRLASQLK